MWSDYEIVSSTQSGVTFTYTNTNNRITAWCDAVVAASPLRLGADLHHNRNTASPGSSAQTVCTISPASTDQLKSCTAYADYNTAVTFPANPSGQASNTRWQPSGSLSFTQTTGGNVDNVNYYKQLQNTYQATPNAQVTWDPGLTAQNAVGTYLGTGSTTICTITLTSGTGRSRAPDTRTTTSQS